MAPYTTISYRGGGGVTKCDGVNGIKFEFSDYYKRNTNTDIAEGQVPEIYYIP